MKIALEEAETFYRSEIERLKAELAMAFRVVENHKAQEAEAVRIGCENITSREKAEAALASSEAAWRDRVEQLKAELARLREPVGDAEIKEAVSCVQDGICHGYKHTDNRPCWKHRQALARALRQSLEREARKDAAIGYAKKMAEVLNRAIEGETWGKLWAAEQLDNFTRALSSPAQPEGPKEGEKR